ncbi:MAG: hypothetical protein V7K77_13550 [Nostoc sp.]
MSTVAKNVIQSEFYLTTVASTPVDSVDAFITVDRGTITAFITVD